MRRIERQNCGYCGNLIVSQHAHARYCSRSCSNNANAKLRARAYNDSFRKTFWSRVEKTATCWLWRGYRSGSGYGAINLNRRSHCAHRLAYTFLVGPIPDGLELDHLCRNRLCVNPAHLEPVTTRENVLRGNGPAAQHARKTHCVNGHPYDESNTYYEKGGRWRRCRACSRASSRQYLLRKRAEVSRA